MFIKYLRRKAIAITKSRNPDFVIGDPKNPYMLRWWWLPRNKFFNIYIHRFLKDDDDRALHDHPWPSFSIMCEGYIRENYIGYHTDGSEYSAWRNIYPGDLLYRPASFAHRILVLPGGDKLPLTIFITGPKIREWGFLCTGGWRHWKDFVASENDTNSLKGQIGCGEMENENSPTMTGRSVIHCRNCGRKHHTSTTVNSYCKTCVSSGNHKRTKSSLVVPATIISAILGVVVWVNYFN